MTGPNAYAVEQTMCIDLMFGYGVSMFQILIALQLGV